MDKTKNQWGSVRFLFQEPEGRLFWIFFGIAVGIGILGAVHLPLFLAVALNVLLLALAATVFGLSYRAAHTNFMAKFEQSELKEVLLNIEDAILVYDLSFRVLYFNHAAERLFGLKAETVLDTEVKTAEVKEPTRQLLVQVVFPTLAPTFSPLTKTGVYPHVAELSFSDPERELKVTTLPLLDGARTLGFVKIIRDRTSELPTVRSKDEFVTVVSHQLRTPITDIGWSLELLSQDQNLSPETKDLVSQTLAAAQRLHATVDDLLSIAKIEEGQFGYQFESVDIVNFIGEVLTSAMSQATRTGIKLYFDPPSNTLPPVMLDKQRMTMALNNLLDNAIRYNVPNGEVVISVTAQTEAPFLEVSVRDTGIGIPLEEINKVFGKFFRAKNALKFQTEGSGLGLYIAKNVIRSHGGTIWAESEINRGTNIHFTLPTDPSLVPQKEVALRY